MLAFLTHRKDAPMPDTTPIAETEQVDSSVVMRFLTQGGAHVHVAHTGIANLTSATGYTYGARTYDWKCLGCDETGGSYRASGLDGARQDANDHAAACRSMPKPTTPQTCP